MSVSSSVCHRKHSNFLLILNRWMPSESDGQLVYRHVIDALKTLPNLRCIEIYFSKFEIPLELDSFLGLDEIIVSTVKASPLLQDEILENLAKAIARNPGLKSLTISGIPHYGRPEASRHQSLHQLFKYYPANAPPLRLRNLRLKSFLVRLDDINIRHLQHLTSLSLQDVDDPNYVCLRLLRHGYFFDQKHQGLNQERKLYGSSTEEIWRRFTSAGVHLEKITVDEGPESFLEYLSSYSGLRELDLTPGGFTEGSVSDAIAVRFFDGILLSHAKSLEILRILPRYEGRWCFSSCNSEQLSMLTKLKHLAVAVQLSSLKTVHDRKSDQTSLHSKPDAIVSNQI